MGKLLEKLKSQGAEEVKPEPKKVETTDTVIEADLDSWERILPLGVWQGLIAGLPVLEKNKKSNWLQMIVPLEVLITDKDGNESERKSQVYFTFSDTALGFIRMTFDDLGIKYTHDGKNIHFDRAQFMNMEVKVLVQESKTGKGRNITLKPADYTPEE
jgi:hypothetical protein